MKKLFLIIVAATFVLFLFFYGLLRYDYYFSPLAGLYRSIDYGDGYDFTKKKFDTLAIKYANDPGLVYKEESSTFHLFKGRSDKALSLFLYSDGVFDDVQLQVRFGGSLEVKEILYLYD